MNIHDDVIRLQQYFSNDAEVEDVASLGAKSAYHGHADKVVAALFWERRRQSCDGEEISTEAGLQKSGRPKTCHCPMTFAGHLSFIYIFIYD